MSGRRSQSQPPPKTVVVFRNGDAFDPGRRFVVSRRQSATFDSFLNVVTGGITAPFGAVRNIYTPDKGHRVLDLEQLVHGEKYVAAGTEKLKKVEYHHKPTQKPQKKKSDVIQPVVHSRIIVPARWKSVSNESYTINVFTNGDVLVPPARVLIPKHTLSSWDSVLAVVTEKVHLRSGGVHRLCTLSGKPLRGAYELQNNQYYVAVGPERFRALPYDHPLYGKDASEDFTDEVRNGPTVKKESQDKELSEKPATGTNDSVFYAKTDRAKSTRHSHDIPDLFTTADKSVFRPTTERKEPVAVSEVLEDEGMRVDLPMDMVEVKEIEEE